MKPSGFALTAALALVLVALTATLATAQTMVRPATVESGHTSLGRVLVNRSGRTLYLFEKDKRGQSACSGACTAYWPPLLVKGKPHATKGAKQSLVGTIKRADGTRQVTYAGHPLYRFSGDLKRGDTTGEGLTDFGGSWDAVAPSGKKIERD